ncbi:hypothetical protein OAO19_03030 [Gammaproteobacteria bacterium]|nr:hypothetical protein [Gammaproteobacteria bacterium]
MSLDDVYEPDEFRKKLLKDKWGVQVKEADQDDELGNRLDAVSSTVLKNKDTGQWEVTVAGGVYSFLDECDALQFANLQQSLKGEYNDR